MNVGSVLNLFLLFSDPELGQVQPTPNGGSDVMLLLGIMVCAYVVIMVLLYMMRR